MGVAARTGTHGGFLRSTPSLPEFHKQSHDGTPHASNHAVPLLSPKLHEAEAGVAEPDPGIFDLLAEQCRAAQLALDCNRAIVHRLTDMGFPGVLPEPTPDKDAGDQRSVRESPQASNDAHPSAFAQVGVSAELTKPLLDQSTCEPLLPSICGAGGIPHRPSSSPVALARDPLPRTSTKEYIRERVQKSLKKIVYNVEDFYHTTGCWQAIAKNVVFQGATLLAIAFNTIWIAIDTDYNKAPVLSQAPMLFIVVNNFFCTFFFLEICTRALAFRHKGDAFRDGWFLFDLSLVLLMSWETWIQVFLFWISEGAWTAHTRSSSILRVFRIFRLTRVARMARLLRAVPELMILVKGMATAMRSVFATLCLLFLVIYIFAIIFVQLLSGTALGGTYVHKFDSVPTACNFLLVQVVTGFDADFIDAMLTKGFIYYFLFLVYLLFASMTIMNMLIGVLCEVVSGVAQDEKEDAFLKEVEMQVQSMVRRLDADGDQSVTIHEFDGVMDSSEIMHDLQDLGVDVVAFVDFAHFVFRDKDELTVSEFLEMVLQFRGSKAATVKDVVDMRKFVSMELEHLEARMKKSGMTAVGGPTAPR